jgi:RimJ/RimL family protein N-acetyltransferase
MEPRIHELKNGLVLLIREAEAQDARAVLDYVEDISGESDFLTFGPGEFELTEAKEEKFLRQYRDSDNQLYLVGLIADRVVSTLVFSAGRRSRVRHSGELGLTVRKEVWGLGIGSLMLDALIDWAMATQIVHKIDLRVRTDNQRAIALYQHHGFVIEGTLHKEMFVDGKYLDLYWMGLELRYGTP